jgi:hypothetical protein
MAGWLKSRLKGPEPSGPTETLRLFRTSDPTLTRDGVTIEEDGWVIDAQEARTVRLFEVQAPPLEQIRLTYRARVMSTGLSGRAYLEMWCRLPGRGEFFSKGLHQAVKGTTGWTCCETPFVLKKGQRPDLVKLNLVVEGTGRVGLKDVELLTTPLG